MWGKNMGTEQIVKIKENKHHPFPFKLCLGFSWSRTTGFSTPLARWQAAPIPRWPRRVLGPWVWIPMETGSSCSTCWRFTVMTPCWCQSSCAAAESTDGVKLQVLHYWILEQCETSDPHPCPTTCFNWFVVNPPPCWFCLTKMEASGWRVPIKDAKYSTCTQFEMSVWRFSLNTTKLQKEHTCSLVYSVWYGPTLPRHRCSANTSSCEHSFLSPNLTFDDRQHAKCVNEFIRLLASWMLHESTALVFAASVVGAPTADSFHRFTQAQT